MIPLRWVPPLVWAAVVLTATSIPNLSIRGPEGSDKIAHFVMYLLFGFLVERAAAPTRSFRAALLTILAGGAFAAADEWHQRFIPGRSADLADWRADFSGVVIGALLGWAVSPAPRRMEHT